MVDQVRFPPSIGGSGKIYTNDANPETGMFGGGHRINFFPIQSDMIAAAGYVSQYAQAIDGAKANADRAEDAKGYVEAVADAYNVNLLEQFRRKATLGLDFIEGRYWKDDGVRLETNDLAEVSSFERNTQKKEEGPGGSIRAVEENKLARAWRLGRPVGATIDRSRTNHLLWSEDFSQSAWNKASSFLFEPTSIKSPVIDVNYTRLIESNGSDFRQASQDVSLNAGQKLCLICFVKEETGGRNIGIRVSNTSWASRINATFNPSAGEFVEQGSSGSGQLLAIKSIPFPDGGYMLFIAGIPDDNNPSVTRVTLSMSNSSSSLPSYQGDGVSKLLVAAMMLSRGLTIPAYTKTEGLPSSMSGDLLKSILSNVFTNSGTIYLEFCSELPPAESIYPLWIGAEGGSTTTKSILVWRPPNLSTRFLVYSGGTLIASLSGFDTDFSKISKIAISYSPEGINCSLNGRSLSTALSQNSTEGLSQLMVLSNPADIYPGVCREAYFLPQTLTLSELGALTTL